MNQDEVLDRMHNLGIVAVLRSESVEQALRVSESCINGGVDLIEITFSVPRADEAIAALQKTKACIGAGTVLNKEQAQRALEAGAQFLVAPTFNQDVFDCAKNAKVLYVPGCMTVNEMQSAYEQGCRLVKLFPASEFSSNYIKAIHAPLPHLNIMPTGGINLKNTREWISGGAFAVGVGGNLTKVANNDFQTITETAQHYCDEILAGRA